MKNRWICVLLLGILSGSGAFPASAQDNFFKKSVSAVKDFFKGGKKADSDSLSVEIIQEESVFDDYPVSRLYELSLGENLAIPSVGEQRENVRGYQQVQAKKLIAAGTDGIETMRNGEVIVATIECDRLFLPNDTVLKPGASNYLQPYLRFMQVPDMYRMLLAMHSDDTGTVAYTDGLTAKRVLAVLEWLEANLPNADYVIPYGMGASEPLLPNNSMANREKNRRLEIYLVPGKTMIELSEKGELLY